MKAKINKIDGNSIVEVHTILREFADLVCGHIFGEVNRGKSIFKGQPPNTDALTQVLTVDVDDDGDYFVETESYRFPILWSLYAHTPQQRIQCQLVAKRLSMALQFAIPDDVGQLREEINKVLQEEGTFRSLLDTARRELEKYSRWKITVTLTNVGGKAVSIDPRLALYVLARGVDYESEGRVANVEVNYKVDFRRIVAAGTRSMTIGMPPIQHSLALEVDHFSDAPIVISPGSAVTVGYWSLNRLSQVDKATNLLNLFNGPGCDALVRVLPLAGIVRLWGGPTVESEVFRFRQFDYDTVFPPAN